MAALAAAAISGWRNAQIWCWCVRPDAVCRRLL